MNISNHYLEGIQLALIEKKAAREENNIGEKTEPIVGVLTGSRVGNGVAIVCLLKRHKKRS